MHKTIGTLLLAVAAAMISLPAVAAPPPPHVQFGFNFGYPPPPPPDSYGSGDECLSTGEILGDVRSMGYRSVRFINDDGDVLTVRARLGYRRYILQLDDCSGDLISRRRY